MEEQILNMKARLAEIETLAKSDHLEALERKCNALEQRLENDVRVSIRSETTIERAERKIRELALQNAEDQKDYKYLESVVNQLANVVDGYQSRISMVQDIAAENLAKYQETERRLAAARERANLAEEQLRKMRSGP